jgi:iron(III) transport system permease protein
VSAAAQRNADAITTTPRAMDWSRPLFVVVGLILVILVVLPLFWLAYYSVTDTEGHLTFENFEALFTDRTLRRPVAISFIMALGVAAVSFAIATPLAWLVARTNLPGRGLVRIFITASFVTPPFLGAIAWEILAAPNTGLINQVYRTLFDLQPYEALVDIYTLEGLIFAISCYAFPLVFTLAANAFERIPADLEEASAILGASRAVTLRRVTWPLVLPAIIAGTLLAFLQALTMFGSPAILALPAGFHVITTKIWSLFQFPPKPGIAAAAAFPLLLVTIILLWVQRRILGRRGYTMIGGKSGSPKLIPLGPWRWLAFGFALLILSLTVILPYCALLHAAFARTVSEPVSLSNLTLHNFRFVLFEFSATQLAISNTLVLGLASATIGTAIGLIVAYLVSRDAFWGASALGTLATMPIAIPGIVLGVGLFLAYSTYPFMLYGTLWILLIAFVTIEMPAGYQQLSTAFKSINPELEEASRILGATRLGTLRKITAPLLRTNVIATWCLIFIGTIRELSATILLTTANTKIVSVIIYDLNESGDLGAISVLGILLLVISFAVVLLANRLPLLGGAPKMPVTQ